MSRTPGPFPRGSAFDRVLDSWILGSVKVADLDVAEKKAASQAEKPASDYVGSQISALEAFSACGEMIVICVCRISAIQAGCLLACLLGWLVKLAAAARFGGCRVSKGGEESIAVASEGAAVAKN